LLISLLSAADFEASYPFGQGGNQNAAKQVDSLTVIENAFPYGQPTIFDCTFDWRQTGNAKDTTLGGKHLFYDTIGIMAFSIFWETYSRQGWSRDDLVTVFSLWDCFPFDDINLCQAYSYEALAIIGSYLLVGVNMGDGI
jgi:hypothetical protein